MPSASRPVGGRVAEDREMDLDLDTALNSTESGCRLWLPEGGHRKCGCRCLHFRTTCEPGPEAGGKRMHGGAADQL